MNTTFEPQINSNEQQQTQPTYVKTEQWDMFKDLKDSKGKLLPRRVRRAKLKAFKKIGNKG